MAASSACPIFLDRGDEPVDYHVRLGAERELGGDLLGRLERLYFLGE